MYQKYTTEALVLGSREKGEHDKLFTLYTERFGLVYGRASGVRHLKSKMRTALTSFSLVKVSLIKGKAGWRIAGAQNIDSAFAVGIERVAAFARIAQLVTRLIHGEEESEYLYLVLKEARSMLFRGEATIAGTIELVTVARILHSLGYVSQAALELALFTHTSIGNEVLHEAEVRREQLVNSINRALNETHL